jgi:hypothetical protein
MFVSASNGAAAISVAHGSQVIVMCRSRGGGSMVVERWVWCISIIPGPEPSYGSPPAATETDHVNVMGLKTGTPISARTLSDDVLFVTCVSYAITSVTPASECCGWWRWRSLVSRLVSLATKIIILVKRRPRAPSAHMELCLQAASPGLNLQHYARR